MKIAIRNLGAIDRAEFSLGDFTVICGNNNTGKTYATYALYGFLVFWREGFSLPVPEDRITELFDAGILKIDLNAYVKRQQAIVDDGCKEYVSQLPSIFASSQDRFQDAEFHVTLDVNAIRPLQAFEQKMQSAKSDLFVLSKSKESDDLIVTLLVEKKEFQVPRDVVKNVVGNALKDIVFGRALPRPFIASAERTGAAIFRKELDFARNRLLEQMSQAGKKQVDPFDLLFQVYQDYALPVKKNVEFVRDLESLAKKSSFIMEQHPGILEDFSDIIGGEYVVNRDDKLFFIPQNGKVKLAMAESSSAVRSLLDLGFYLRYVAKSGDLLMVDEPELNLHPANQRRVARLLARLVNLGVRVFITTHSDYIIKELNALIMMGRDLPRMRKIAEQEKYRREELLLPEKIKVYIAEEALINLGDGGKRKRRQTLTSADVTADYGIDAGSFDKTIDEMNRIQDEILWGEE